MLNELFTSLGVKDNERARLALGVVFSFAIGLAQLFTISIPLSLFLSTYSVDRLPYVYIASAIATLLSGIAFTLFQKKVKMLRLISGALYACSIVLLVFWALLNFTEIKLVILFLPVFCWVIFEVCNLLTTSLVSHLFTFAEGKRVYGVIASFKAAGSALAGLASPLIVYFINAKHIIAITAGALGFALFIFTKIRKRYFTSATASSAIPMRDQLDMAIAKHDAFALYKSSYLLLIFLFSALTIFEYYSLNMLFSQVIKQQFPDVNAMASIFGMFFAAVGILSMVISAYAFSKINEKFGIIFSLLLMPATVGILIALAISVGMLSPELSTIILILVSLAFLMDETLRASFNDEIIALLYQPLSLKERSSAQVHNGLVITPIATGIIGAFLLIVSHRFSLSIVTLSVITLTLCMGALMVLWPIRNRFIGILETVIKKRKITHLDFIGLDKVTINELKKYLQSDNEAKVIHALSYFDKFNKSMLIDALPQALKSPAKAIQKFALEKIIEYGHQALFTQVVALAKNTDDKELKSLAIIALAIDRSAESDNLLLNYLSINNPAIKPAVMVGLIKYRSKEQQSGISELKRMLNSNVDEEKIQAAQIIEQCNRQDLANNLAVLLNDSNPHVRIAASKASVNLMNSELFLAIVNNLSDKHSRQTHLRHLKMAGNKVIPLLTHEFAHLNNETQRFIVSLLGLLRDGELTPFIFQHIDDKDNYVRHRIICQLSAYDFDDMPNEIQKQISRELNREAMFIKKIHGLLIRIAKVDKAGLATSLLQREVALAKERVVNLLSCFYDHQQFSTILAAMKTGDIELASYTYELLFQLLNKKDKGDYLAFFDAHDPDVCCIARDIDNEAISAFMTEVMIVKKMFVIPGTSAAILYWMSELGIERVLEALAVDDADSVQLETYRWLAG